MQSRVKSIIYNSPRSFKKFVLFQDSFTCFRAPIPPKIVNSNQRQQRMPTCFTNEPFPNCGDYKHKPTNKVTKNYAQLNTLTLTFFQIFNFISFNKIILNNYYVGTYTLYRVWKNIQKWKQSPYPILLIIQTYINY